MCGIAGFVGNNISEEMGVFYMKCMMDKLAHRGPDDEGSYVEKNIFLGHRRLSIHDLSSNGSQPMTSLTGRYILSFNGEIYNYLSLKKELKTSGYSFKSTSDTEVLLNLIEEFGFEIALSKCVGMFAIALWDRKRKKLQLARDRFGEKPVYYGWHNGYFLYGSELKSLISHPSFEKKIDNSSLNLFFKYGYIKSPYCIYKNTFKLEPGKILSLDVQENLIQGSESITDYWSIENITSKGILEPFQGDFREASLELEKLILESVKIQMHSDVPLGAFLSGGVDSSLIVSMMQNIASENISTFTIGFLDSRFNEAEHAMIISEHLGTNHKELYLDNHEVSCAAMKMSSIYDEPFSDPSQIPTYLVSCLAKEEITVSLSGDGGDELFYGYSKYLLAENISKVPFRRVLSQLIAKSPRILAKFANLSPYKVKNIDAQSLEFFALLLGSINKIELSKILSEDRLVNNLLVKNEDSYSKDGYLEKDLSITNDTFQAMMYSDRKTYLPDDVLTKVDRASMAVSLETRVPLLDHRIFEFSSTLPKSYLYSGGVQKKVLKDVLFRYLPKQIMDRPKTGFSPPISAWLRDELKEWAGDLLHEDNSANEFINLNLAKDLFKQHNLEEKDNSHLLWKIASFLDWQRKWIT